MKWNQMRANGRLQCWEPFFTKLQRPREIDCWSNWGAEDIGSEEVRRGTGPMRRNGMKWTRMVWKSKRRFDEVLDVASVLLEYRVRWHKHIGCWTVMALGRRVLGMSSRDIEAQIFQTKTSAQRTGKNSWATTLAVGRGSSSSGTWRSPFT